jgi:diguanylate cyclase (GGDEF)-like protein
MPQGYFAGLQATQSAHLLAPATVLRLAQHILGMSTTFYTRLDDEAMTVQGVYQATEADGCPITKGAIVPLDETYCQFVYRSGRPLVVADSHATAPFDALLTTRDFAIGGYAGVPLIAHDGTIIGTLCGLDRGTTAISDEQIALLQMLAHALMVGLERGMHLEELEQQRAVALLDALTGLPNRRAFDHALLEGVIRAAHDSMPLGLIFIDIDHFKRVNDTYGHCVGDEMLRIVACRLANGLRDSDTLFRFGGEELIALIPRAHIEESLAIAERLCKALHEPLSLGALPPDEAPPNLPKALALTASFGVAVYPADAASAEGLLKCADAAMYAAKNGGRDRVCTAAAIGICPDIPKPGPMSLYTIAHNPVVDVLAAALAARDGYTGEHGERLMELAETLALRLGRSEEEARLAGIAARLHDIGKLGVPDAILRKTGPLTTTEWDEMRQHPTIGQQILQEGGGTLNLLAGVVGAHHERWDGTGYPRGLKGEAIPLAARIIAVIDAFDAMTTDRPYRQALPLEEAFAELRDYAGQQFDPTVVETFLATFQVLFPADVGQAA